MNYIVSIKNKTDYIGAKNRSAQFTHKEDAMHQFYNWLNWLKADLDRDKCDFINFYAESRDYELTLIRHEIVVPRPAATIQEIDEDSRS